MKILDGIITDAQRYSFRDQNDLRIDNIILGKTLYTMKGSETVFSDMNFCLILFENAYGFSYFQGEIDYSLINYVNKNALEVLREEIPTYMRVAVADALYCLINKIEFTETNILTGSIREKAKKRAQVLLSHIPDGAKVLLLGAATEIIEEASIKNCALKIFDLEKQKIGLKFESIHIENGNESDLEKEIKETDFVIATGMIFVSETADKIFDLVTENKKNLTLYMETGSNFGPQLLKYGANTVLSEFFPYYDFFGETKYSLLKID